MRQLLILAFVFLLAAPAQSQTAAPTLNKDAYKDVCLEKQIANLTRLLFADKDRLKIGLLVEDITWKDEYRKAAIDIIQSQFPNRFVAAPDQSLGVVILYISGTSAVSNGAQFVSIRLQLNSSEMLLAENAQGINDLHVAKLGDPTRVVLGALVFAENGALLPPLEEGMHFELWHQLNLQTIRENITKTLSEFVEKWDKAGKKLS